MSKAKTILKDLRNLDLYIASLIRRRDKIEASFLSSPKWSSDKVSGGVKRKQDDVYTEFIATKENIAQKTAEAVRKQRELEDIIDSLDDTTSKTILSMVYIDKMTIYDVSDCFNRSTRTCYKLLDKALKDLDNALQ